MKKLRQKLASFYWNAVGKHRKHRYFRQKNKERFQNWRNGFRITDLPAHPVDSRCIVVCAHPDDETLYFYSVLKQQNPFVICMSNVGDPARSKEFYKALDAQGVNGMMLNLPDVPHMAWAWRLFSPKALKKAAKYCPFAERIYTHSPIGESHHPHHYATGAAAKKVFSGYRILTTAPEASPDCGGALSPEDVAQKHRILKECYPSQIKMLETWYPWWDGYLKTEYFKE